MFSGSCPPPPQKKTLRISVACFDFQHPISVSHLFLHLSTLCKASNNSKCSKLFSMFCCCKLFGLFVLQKVSPSPKTSTHPQVDVQDWPSRSYIPKRYVLYIFVLVLNRANSNWPNFGCCVGLTRSKYELLLLQFSKLFKDVYITLASIVDRFKLKGGLFL